MLMKVKDGSEQILGEFQEQHYNIQHAAQRQLTRWVDERFVCQAYSTIALKTNCHEYESCIETCNTQRFELYLFIFLCSQVAQA